MQNDDHTSIKYLMKELDPAEAVQFEQRMMEDEELLVEVECMRRTLRQLEKLPVKQPPSELTEYIVRKACSRNCSSHWRKWWAQADRSLTKYYAAAALILVGMGLGLLSFQYTEPEKGSIQVEQPVTRADIAGSSGLSGKQNLPTTIKMPDQLQSKTATSQTRGSEGILDTIDFQQMNENPTFLPPLRSRFQQTGTIEFTGANR